MLGWLSYFRVLVEGERGGEWTWRVRRLVSPLGQLDIHTSLWGSRERGYLEPDYKMDVFFLLSETFFKVAHLCLLQ